MNERKIGAGNICHHHAVVVTDGVVGGSKDGMGLNRSRLLKEEEDAGNDLL